MALSSDTITLGVRISPNEFWADTNIQSIAEENLFTKTIEIKKI
jgi:hypothetical protein